MSCDLPIDTAKALPIASMTLTTANECHVQSGMSMSPESVAVACAPGRTTLHSPSLFRGSNVRERAQQECDDTMPPPPFDFTSKTHDP